MTAREEPMPVPFPVGVQVEYLGPDEADFSDGLPHWEALQHGIIGLVVENHPGVPGRAPGVLGPEDPGFETVHGYSDVAYLSIMRVRVAGQAGRGRTYGADQFRNLQP